VRRALYALFSTYGWVLDLESQNSFKMRGKAFVSFTDVTSAATAMRALQGFLFYDRPLVSLAAR
jgi:U2 small nuclear ribonucleoprotein B''